MPLDNDGSSPASKHERAISRWKQAVKKLRVAVRAQQKNRNGSESSEPTKQPSPSQPHASFLDLPGELRNLIYHYVFHPGRTDLLVGGDFVDGSLSPGICGSHIGQTNRRVRAEALSFLCATKRFLFLSPPTAAVFLRRVAPEGLRTLTHLQLSFQEEQFEGYDAKGWHLRLADVLRSCEALKLLRLDLGLRSDRQHPDRFDRFHMLADMTPQRATCTTLLKWPGTEESDKELDFDRALGSCRIKWNIRFVDQVSRPLYELLWDGYEIERGLEGFPLAIPI